MSASDPVARARELPLSDLREQLSQTDEYTLPTRTEALALIDAAEAAVALAARLEALEGALRDVLELATVSWEGDPWYAENEGIDVDGIFARARAALAVVSADGPRAKPDAKDCPYVSGNRRGCDQGGRCYCIEPLSADGEQEKK